MKQIFTLILGDLGLFLVGAAAAIASWFLFPIFIAILRSSIFLSTIGLIFVCPIAVGFYASSVLSAMTLILRGAKAKKWWWLCLGLLLLAINIMIVIKSVI